MIFDIRGRVPEQAGSASTRSTADSAGQDDLRKARRRVATGLSRATAIQLAALGTHPAPKIREPSTWRPRRAAVRKGARRRHPVASGRTPPFTVSASTRLPSGRTTAATSMEVCCGSGTGSPASIPPTPFSSSATLTHPAVWSRRFHHRLAAKHDCWTVVKGRAPGCPGRPANGITDVRPTQHDIRGRAASVADPGSSRRGARLQSDRSGSCRACSSVTSRFLRSIRRKCRLAFDDGRLNYD